MSDLFAQPGPHGRLPYAEVVVADTETTGLCPWGTREDGGPSGDPYGPDRLCSLHLEVFLAIGGGWIPARSALSFWFDPERPVPEAAAMVNGFHWSGDGSAVPAGRRDLRGEADFGLLVPEITRFIGVRPLVFHNAVFDMAVLDAELARVGHEPLPNPVACTKKSFAEAMGLGRPDAYVPGTNLDALCACLGVDRSARAAPDGTPRHGAAVDTALAAACFARLEPLVWMLAEPPENLPHRRFQPEPNRAKP